MPGATASAASAASSNATNARFGVSGPVEVEGELAGLVGAGEDVGGLFLERVGNATVKAGTLGRQKVGVDDFADERVPESVRVRLGVHHEDLRVDAGSDGGLERVGSSRSAILVSSWSWLVACPPLRSRRARAGVVVQPAMSAAIRSDNTAGIVSPARCAATSSSVKNGLPSPRARTCSTRFGGRARR